MDDREGDESDDEPSLGFLENHPYPTYGSLHFASRDQSGGQESMCQGFPFNVEEQCDDEGDASDSGIADAEGMMEQCPHLFQYSSQRVEWIIMANQSRRGFLAYLGLAGATTAVTAAAIAPASEPKMLRQLPAASLRSRSDRHGRSTPQQRRHHRGVPVGLSPGQRHRVGRDRSPPGGLGRLLRIGDIESHRIAVFALRTVILAMTPGSADLQQQLDYFAGLPLDAWDVCQEGSAALPDLPNLAN